VTIAGLYRGAVLNRAAIESLIRLAADVTPIHRCRITDLFANGRVERESREFAVRWLLRMFVTTPDPFDRAQMSLRIAENVVPAISEDLVRLIEDRKYGDSRAGLLTALATTKHPRAAEVIASVLHEKHLDWSGIEALAKLKATEYVDTIRTFLGSSNPDVRRQARRALKKLGFPVATPPRPVHLIRKPKIAATLAEWSIGLDMDDVEPTLEKLASCIDRGFGVDEIAEVTSTLDDMKVDQTRTFRFPVVVQGAESELFVEIFLDDIDSPDLAVHAAPGTIERFSSLIQNL